MTTTTGAPPCTSENIDGCTSCGRIMHRRRRGCDRGHPRHKSRGRCLNCFNTDRKAAQRPTPHRDRLMQAWADLAEMGVRFDEFPRHQGITYTAWERAFQRARNAGHPLARRYDKGT